MAIVNSPAITASSAVRVSPCVKKLTVAAAAAAAARPVEPERWALPHPAVQIAIINVALSTSTTRLVAQGSSGRRAARKKATKIAPSTAQKKRKPVFGGGGPHRGQRR